MKSRKNLDIPFSSDDLRRIADQMDEIADALGDLDAADDRDWRWGFCAKISEDGDWLDGEVRAHGDGWYGFYPEGWQ